MHISVITDISIHADGLTINLLQIVAECSLVSLVLHMHMIELSKLFTYI